VPVTTFVISILSGYNMSKLEVTGAIITIAALVSNNLYQRKLSVRRPRRLTLDQRVSRRW